MADSPSATLLASLKDQDDHLIRNLLLHLDDEEIRLGHYNLEALRAAAREHERVRRAAESARELQLLEDERQRQDEEAEQRRVLQRERHARVEQEIAQRERAIEDARQLEQRRKAAEDAALQAEEEERQRAQRRREEDQRLQERRKAEAEAAKCQARQEQERKLREEQASSQQKQPDANGSAPNGVSASAPAAGASGPSLEVSGSPGNDREAEHDRYMRLHTRLKQWSRSFEAEAKKNPQLKGVIGDWRRAIRKFVSQPTLEKATVSRPTAEIKAILRKALQVQQPWVDVREFLASPLPSGFDPSRSHISALFLYELYMFTRAIIARWMTECSATPKQAETAGIMAISVFAAEDFRFQGVSLIDMLLAKLHKNCPVLFGIWGNDEMEKGRARLGWARERDDEDSPKHWVTEQRHSERMAGLGVGFASLSLRDFAKSKMTNPYPHSHYWQAMARIVNTPPGDITASHLVVLKAMIENHAAQFIGFYGKAATVALRCAIVDFPKKAPSGPDRKALETLSSTIRF